MIKLLKKIIQRILKKKPNKLQDLCVVGLGNPGDKYHKTRHNAGYDFLDLIAKELKIEFKNSKKFEKSVFFHESVVFVAVVAF